MMPGVVQRLARGCWVLGIWRRAARFHHATAMSQILQNGDLLLFQGDSITDGGRGGSADGLGAGYVCMVRGLLTARHPELAVRIMNLGVGGDRTVELLARWQADCLAIKPQVLSLMIGVNDVWRLRGMWNNQTFVPIAEYRANYVKLLDQARAAGVRQLVLMSPTTIAEENDPEISRHLDERAACVRELAAQYQAVYVPTRETILRALREQPKVRWTNDGCHPTQGGHALIAGTWLKAVGY
jgi:lysophospholipase L1-like esterase